MTGPDELDRARMYQEAGRVVEARAMLAAHLASQPDDVRAICMMTKAQLDLKQPKEARELARRAISLEPDNEWGWRLLALSESANDNIYDARIAAKTAIGLAPSSWLAHLVRANVDTRAKLITAETRVAAATARTLAPNVADVHITFGNVALADGQLLRAESSYRAALAIDPQNSVARNNLAVVALRQNPAGGAAATFVDLLAEDPTWGLALRNLRAAARRALRVIHLVLIIGFFAFSLCCTAAVSDTVASPDLGFVHPVLLVVAAVELAIIVIFILRFRRASGRQFRRFLTSIVSIDRGAVAWAALLLLSYVVTIALLVVRPELTVLLRYAIAVPLLIGVLVARVSASRTRR